MKNTCPNGYMSYKEFSEKFMVKDSESQVCLKCNNMTVDSSEGLIMCSLMKDNEESKEDEYAYFGY